MPPPPGRELATTELALIEAVTRLGPVLTVLAKDGHRAPLVPRRRTEPACLADAGVQATVIPGVGHAAAGCGEVWRRDAEH